MEIIKPNVAKLLITLLLVILVCIVGVIFYKNPIFLKIGCAPNPSCPNCEICMSWGFPRIINFQALVLFIPLYFAACLIYKNIMKKEKLLRSG